MAIACRTLLRDSFYAVDATIGNYDFYQGAIDLSGPLNSSKSLLYRLNVGYLNRDSFVNLYEREKFAIASAPDSILEICSMSIIWRLPIINSAIFMVSRSRYRARFRGSFDPTHTRSIELNTGYLYLKSNNQTGQMKKAIASNCQ
ncbi:hypothetical protein [Nostoc sp.]|uniref:hypothetical protein n=1 Tax=Nostoc sp. TaxID=1180 RepID=UPI003FA600BE